MKPVIIITLAFVLLIPTSVHALEVNHESIDLSSSNSIDLVITGNLNDFQSSTRLVLTVIFPNDSRTDYDVLVNENGLCIHCCNCHNH